MLKFIKSISYRDTGQFPKLFLDYIEGKEELRDFFSHATDMSGFKKLIEERKSFNQNKRDILVEHLSTQYSSIEKSEAVARNIGLLRNPNTFTIVTGHQLNLFTGPLYFLYKILTVIRLAEELKINFPKNNFIPIYWMASEDHDFDEIKYFNYRGKKYNWESDQKGAVGDFTLKSMSAFLNSLNFVPENLKAFYKNSSTLGEAHLKLVDNLFSKYGLVVIDANSRMLKAAFSEIIKFDIDNEITNTKVSRSTDSLKKLGYSTPVNPRELNYFYLDRGLRERLEKSSGTFFYHNTKGEKVEIGDSNLFNSPERISPNVITRPIYQETILPNLAYIGGPSELAYWLQLKDSFRGLGVNFPLLLPRFSASILSNKSLDKLSKAGINEIHDIFLDRRETLRKALVQSGKLNTTEFKEWEELLDSLFISIKNAAIQLDKTLEFSVEGRKKKVRNELEKIRKKMESASMRNESIITDRIDFVLNEIFPGGTFQERYSNLIEFSEYSENLISDLYESLNNPLDFNHRLLSYQ